MSKHHNRFLIYPEDIKGGHFKIREDELHHLKVKRLQAGNPVFGLDGKGREIQGQIISLSEREAVCKITGIIEHSEDRIKISLGLAILKPAPFAYAVEKAVELGVSEIIPLETKFSSRKLKAGEILRCERIALSAMKQSGRFHLPGIKSPVSLIQALEQNAGKQVLFADPSGKPAFEIELENKDILALVGAEGGFSQEEIEIIQGAGGQPFSLGKNRLRSETAAIMAVGCFALRRENLTN
jgi:16S rRNA (uracil1498-N3)-methyltransferase